MNRTPFSLLLVEDDLADAALFQELLADISPDIQVAHVENGREALNFLTQAMGNEKARRPDLILLDLNMPVMNGYEFLKAAKQNPAIRTIPVLVLSTSDHPGDVNRSYEAHASGYMVKPGTFPEYNRLLETVESYWRGLMRLPTVEEVTGD